MSDGASGAFRAAMSGEPMPADAGANQPDVFADTGPVNFDDGPSPSEQLRDVVEGAKPELAPKEDGDHVPSWRLREIREDRDRKEAELAAARKEADELREYRKQQEEAAKPKPDLFENTDAWEQSLDGRFDQRLGEKITPVQSRIERIVEDYSKRFAITQHGEEAVNEAETLVDTLVKSGKLDRDTVLKELRESNDPYGDMLAFAKRHKQQEEINGDLDGYVQKQIAAERAKWEAEHGISSAAPQAPAAPRLVTEGPQTAARKSIPSLNRTAAAQGSDEPQGGAATLRSALRGG